MNQVKGKILIAGGGTGGHVYPALATIETLKEKGEFDFLYVGGYQGLENTIVPKSGIPFQRIWISGFQRYFTLKNILFPFKLLVSLMQSWKIIKKFNPDVVVGTGGYVSGPVVYLASRMGIPTLIEEQDSYPGVTTRILSKYADIICIPHQSVNRHLSRAKGRVVVTGNPVRSSLKLVERERAIQYWGLEKNRPVIFVFGGSLGAQAINRAIAEIAHEIIRKWNVQFLWQVGRGNFPEIQQWPVAKEPGVHILSYIDDMSVAYSVADLIISRAGAITLAELALVQKPCILVPYPYAAAGHQEHNARAMQEVGSAIMVKEGEGFPQALKAKIDRIMADVKLQKRMKESWQRIARPNAAEEIAEKVLELINTNYNYSN